jgi:hypothetical protein
MSLWVGYRRDRLRRTSKSTPRELLLYRCVFAAGMHLVGVRPTLQSGVRKPKPSTEYSAAAGLRQGWYATGRSETASILPSIHSPVQPSRFPWPTEGSGPTEPVSLEARESEAHSGGAVPDAGPSIGRSNFAETPFSSSWWEEPTRFSSSTPDEGAFPATRFYVPSPLLAIPFKEKRGPQLPDRPSGNVRRAHSLFFSCRDYRIVQPECARNDYLLRRCLTGARAARDRNTGLFVLHRHPPAVPVASRRSDAVRLPGAMAACTERVVPAVPLRDVRRCKRTPRPDRTVHPL